MSVEFTTKIDVCKRFMYSISGQSLEKINPLVGDLVRVYHDTDFQLFMPVTERKWVITNGETTRLYCYLDLPRGYSIPEFTRMMNGRGFR